jgi:hypothetical protein
MFHILCIIHRSCISASIAAHESIRMARMEGFLACMLPGISAEDLLFAEFGIAPSENGCQSFEVTDFLGYKRKFDFMARVVGEMGMVIKIAHLPYCIMF